LTEHEHPCLDGEERTGSVREPGEARSLDSKFYPNITANITGVCAQATTVARQVQPVPLYNAEAFYSEIIGENSLFYAKTITCAA
jgi:hypothetical protein